METMIFETAAASDGLYLAFPGGLLSTDDIWLGSGWVHDIVLAAGGTTPPVAAAMLKVYDAFDYSTLRPVMNGTTGARYSVRPGGTLAGTRGTYISPTSKIATLSLTNFRELAGMNFLVPSTDFRPSTLLVERPCPCGIIVALTTGTETGTYLCTIHYTPGITGSTRKRNATHLTQQPIALM